MQSAFGTVILVVVAAGLVIGVITLLTGRANWEEFNRRGMLMERERPSAARPMTAPDAERDEEIRQMLEAGNARRRRRGEPTLDIEAELARLTGPASGQPIDAALRQEIRDMVVARNHRRARRGEPPLDVEAEVAREISALGG